MLLPLVASPLAAWQLSDWDVRETTYLHPTAGNVTVSNYTSPSLKLMTGESWFTLNPTERVPFPEGDYAVLATHFRMVDGSGSAQIPLSEVYNHRATADQTMPCPLTEALTSDPRSSQTG